MPSRLLVLIIALMALAPMVGAQEGCSGPEALAQLAQGTFLGTPTDVAVDGAAVLVTFTVDTVFSGPIPSDGAVEVRIPAADWDGHTGLVGVIVTRENAGWVSDRCRLVDPEVLAEVAPTSVSPVSLGENERETLKEPPLAIAFIIFGGGIGGALLFQRIKERRATDG